MPLHETLDGMAHEYARFGEMNVAQLRVRISRIRNPQKMYECVRCLVLHNREGTSPSNRRKAQAVFSYANEKLRGMGFNAEGNEIDEGRARNSMAQWGNTHARRSPYRGRLRSHMAVNPTPPVVARLPSTPTLVRTWYDFDVRITRVDVMRTNTVNGGYETEEKGPITHRGARELINVLLSANVKPRVIAMALGVEIDSLWIIMKHYGVADDRKIRDMKDENDNLLDTTPRVRKISIRKDGQ